MVVLLVAGELKVLARPEHRKSHEFVWTIQTYPVAQLHAVPLVAVTFNELGT